MKRPVIAVPEELVELRVNGARVATWSCSPRDLEALGAGRLLTLGYIRDAADLVAIRIERAQAIHVIEVDVREEAAAAGREDADHQRVHGCGLRFLIDCHPDRLPGRSQDDDRGTAVPGSEAFPDLFRELFDRSTARKAGGGHHTAALSDGACLLHVHDEVGRHNGADKALGSALLHGLDLGALGLVTTARISGEMAEKAARAGVAWVASRSLPTTLAVEIAGVAGVPLIARAASPDARVFEPGAGE